MKAPFQLLVTSFVNNNHGGSIQQQRYNCESLASLIAKRDQLAAMPRTKSIETLVVLEQWSKPT